MKQAQKEGLSPNLDSNSSPMTYDTCPVPTLDDANFLALRPREVSDARPSSDPTSSYSGIGVFLSLQYMNIDLHQGFSTSPVLIFWMGSFFTG